MSDVFSGKKMVFCSRNETLHLHLQRYHFAGYPLPDIIADVICGASLGSYLLAKEYGRHIEQIIAIDIIAKLIDYCKKICSQSKNTYELKDVFEFRPPAQLTL